MAGLLDGLTVLDLSWGMAGPFTGMLLADNGADVIKVEPPGGDPFRFIPAYHVWNRGKRSIILDLKTEAGRKSLYALCAKADVLLESFQPGAAEKLGVGYDVLGKRFPHLVHGSITGYGRDDPRRDKPGYDHLVQAWLGMTEEVQSYRGHPAFHAFPAGAYGAGQLMVTGIMSALHSRSNTGRGQHVETSILDGMFILNTMSWNWVEGAPPRPDITTIGPKLPRRHMMSLGVLECGDGKSLCIHTGVPGRFATALEIFGIADKITPAAPNVEKNAPLTEEERSFLIREIPRILKTKPRDYWLAAFEKGDICSLPVDPPGVVFNDPQTVFDKTIATVNDPELGPIKMVGPILKCADAPPSIRRPAPRAGEHTQEVLAEFKNRPDVAASLKPKNPALNKHPLQGVRIVDFGSYFAGPSASKMLSDLGAEVIKVEPLQGDTLRGSPFAFRPAQRGKRAIAVDTKTPEGRAIVHKLVAKADMVTHNMRPGAAERAGIGYDELSKIRPGLIYLHSPGFGGAGPRSHLPAFAPLISAMAGMQSLAAGQGNAPVAFWSSNEDQTGGCFSAGWLSMALFHRDRTGKGVRLESSLFSAAMMAAIEVILDPKDKALFRFEIDKDQTGYDSLYRLYQAKDGWVMLVVMLEGEWKALTRVPGLEALGDDKRFADRSARRKSPELAQALSKWFAGKSAAEAAAALEAKGVPCEIPGPSKTESFFLDPANIKSGRVATYHRAVDGLVHETGHSLFFSATPGLIRGPAPVLGEHTQEILHEMGYDDKGIDDLRERKVVTWKGAPGAKPAIG
jgi:crotonobetainyl-CoA:carnitine CoA-transferase CaiB-like acyl-CoA transferase